MFLEWIKREEKNLTKIRIDNNARYNEVLPEVSNSTMNRKEYSVL